MARDIFIRLNRCHFCGRRGFKVWDTDLFSCNHEVCLALAFAEVKRRNRNGGAAPEKQLRRALMNSLDTFEYELRHDRDADLIDGAEARRMDELERERTARVLAELHRLERRAAGGPARASAPPVRRRKALTLT
jgi:hypothetical protein